MPNETLTHNEQPRCARQPSHQFAKSYGWQQVEMPPPSWTEARDESERRLGVRLWKHFRT